MWTGLVTVALFFGSMKNTRAFFLACAPAITPSPAIMMTTSSANCFLRVIGDLLFRHILAEPSSKPSATPLFGQPAAGGIPLEHPGGHRGRERGVGGHGHDGHAPARGDLARAGAQSRGGFRREIRADVFQQQ